MPEVDRARQWAGGTVRAMAFQDRIEDVENWAEDKIEGLVAKVAPGIATLIEAYGKLSQEHLEKLARLDKNVLEKFAGWAHDPPPRPGFNNILENIAKQDESTIDLIASLKPKPLALSENAAKVVDTVRIRIAGSEYQIDHEVVEHILQRHSREFWEGSVKAEQSFLPAGFGPDEIVDVIRDVLRQNEAEVARIGVGYGSLPLTTSHGITWQLGLNGGHVGQLYPKF